jgi:Annexin
MNCVRRFVTQPRDGVYVVCSCSHNALTCTALPDAYFESDYVFFLSFSNYNTKATHNGTPRLFDLFVIFASSFWGFSFRQANKQKVIDALATQDATTRTYMAIRYKELFQKDLQETMSKEFSGDLGRALEFLALRPDRAECLMLKRATSGVGASANVVWSIMCGRTNDEIDRLKKTYFEMYSKDLGKLLAKELHGDMERLVFTAMQGGEEPYDPQFHTAEKAAEDAETIHKKGQGKMFGVEERGIFKIICASPKEHLEHISA